VISVSEPPVNNVAWLKPLSDGAFMLFFLVIKDRLLSLRIIRRIEIPIYARGSDIIIEIQ
jgi:hypothetical protein